MLAMLCTVLELVFAYVANELFVTRKHTLAPDEALLLSRSASTAPRQTNALPVTVTPPRTRNSSERDTPSVLADYVSSFHARLVALTGPAPAIQKVALAYKVFFAKSAAARPDGYAIDHTGFIYLVGKDGRYIDFLPPGLAPERIVEALRLHHDRQTSP